MNPRVAEQSRRLRMLFFLDYDDGYGSRFTNSPGLLPFVGHARVSGFEIDFVDSEQELLRLAVEPTVDVVGISSMERMLPRSIAIAERVRVTRSDLILMLGGSSIDPFAEDLVASLFDIVVVGEGEHKLVPLLRAIASAHGLYVEPEGTTPLLTLAARARTGAGADPGGALCASCVEAICAATFLRHVGASRLPIAIGVSGVLLRDPLASKVVLLEPPEQGPAVAERLRLLLPAGEALPRVDLEATPLSEELDALCVYPWEEVEKHRWATLEFYTQRGCRWGRCEFCSVADRNIRALSHEHIIEVLRAAASHGVETVSFSDDLFVQDTAWNRRLLEKLLPLRLGLKYRAQTMPNRTLWPLLNLMAEVGFVELAFGLETVDAARARFMGKSYNGLRYVEGAEETVARVAAAGICPVLYMILADPASTLPVVARELADVVGLLARVYRRTGVVPTLSWSLAMLPVAGPVMTTRFPHSVRTLTIGSRTVRLPDEFDFDPPVARFLTRVNAATTELPHRRENLDVIPLYLQTALAVAIENGHPETSEIRCDVERGLRAFSGFCRRLDRDIERSARLLLADGDGEFTPRLGDREKDARDVGLPHAPEALQFEYTRFGGYIAGVQRYLDLLQAGLRDA